MQLEPSAAPASPASWIVLGARSGGGWDALSAPRGPLRDVVQHDRPRERLLRALARSDDDVLVGGVRGPEHDPRAVATAGEVPASRRGDRAADVEPRASLLDIGCGWAGSRRTRPVNSAATSPPSRSRRSNSFTMSASNWLLIVASPAWWRHGCRTFATPRGSFSSDRLDRDDRVDPRTMWATYFRSLRDLTTRHPGRDHRTAGHHGCRPPLGGLRTPTRLHPEGRLPRRPGALMVLRDLAAYELMVERPGIRRFVRSTLRSWRANFGAKTPRFRRHSASTNGFRRKPASAHRPRLLRGGFCFGRVDVSLDRPGLAEVMPMICHRRASGAIGAAIDIEALEAEGARTRSQPEGDPKSSRGGGRAVGCSRSTSVNQHARACPRADHHSL